MTIYNASKLLHRCQISLRKILWITTNCDAKNCSRFWKPEGGGGWLVWFSLQTTEIIPLSWNFRYDLECEFLAARLTQCSNNLQKNIFFILNTKTFSALFFQLVKTCCNKLLIQETLMLLFYIYKESQSSLSNRVWKAKCKYIIFYRGTCRQVDKKTFFISAIYRSKRPGVFCKKDVLKNFAEFTGKHLCRNHFLKKLQAWPATLLKKWLWHKWFFVNFENFSRTRFLWNISGDCLGIIQNKPQNEQIFINVWHSQKGHIYLNKRVNNNEKLKS